jgi:hypothetical protein
MSKKIIHIKMLTPWGVPLMYKKLKDWADVDENEFMKLHRMVVRTSKDDFQRAYSFNIIPYNEVQKFELDAIENENNYKPTLSLTLGLYDKFQKVYVNSIVTLDAPFINMNNYIKNNEAGVFIQIENKTGTTNLNLSNISPFVLLFFDEEHFFKGTSYCIKSGTGTYSIQTQYKNILVLRMPLEFDLNEVIRIFKH